MIIMKKRKTKQFTKLLFVSKFRCHFEGCHKLTILTVDGFLVISLFRFQKSWRFFLSLGVRRITCLTKLYYNMLTFKGVRLTAGFVDAELADMKAHIAMIEEMLKTAEVLFIS